jgi:DUF971 family protein
VEAPRLLPLAGADPSRPREVSLVGRYALGVTWSDGHGSIYPFEALRSACPCGGCPPPAPAWPAEIRREPTALRVRWQDGHETVLAHRDLRGRCPCALCGARPPGGAR